MPCGLSVGYYAFDCALDALMSNEMDWRILIFPRIKWERGKYSRRNGALKECISGIPQSRSRHDEGKD